VKQQATGIKNDTEIIHKLFL